MARDLSARLPKIRITPAEHMALQHAAKLAGMTYRDYLLALTLLDLEAKGYNITNAALDDPELMATQLNRGELRELTDAEVEKLLKRVRIFQERGKRATTVKIYDDELPTTKPGKPRK